MKDVIYVKCAEDYDDVIKNKSKRIPMFCKKIIFIYKNIFNKITMKNVEGYNIFILPIFNGKYSINKMKRLLNRLPKKEGKIYALENSLMSNEIYKILKLYEIELLSPQRIKKFLLVKVLDYINIVQNTDINSNEITILVNEATDLNFFIIEEIAKKVKNLKIVSLNIYKFKKFEENLYNKYGIAIQFSNSYKKSLLKSKIIVNLDFGEIDINEYEIFNKSIIINCTDKNIKIKSKLFNGLIINSYDIKFKSDLKEKYRKINLYNKYNNILLYEAKLKNECNFYKIFENLEEDKVIISNLFGNNGIINKKEIKNMFKGLTKYEKQSNIL